MSEHSDVNIDAAAVIANLRADLARVTGERDLFARNVDDLGERLRGSLEDAGLVIRALRSTERERDEARDERDRLAAFLAARGHLACSDEAAEANAVLASIRAEAEAAALESVAQALERKARGPYVATTKGVHLEFAALVVRALANGKDGAE